MIFLLTFLLFDFDMLFCCPAIISNSQTQEKIRADEYKGKFDLFAKDVDLLIDNAKIFNEPSSLIVRDASHLEVLSLFLYLEIPKLTFSSSPSHQQKKLLEKAKKILPVADPVFFSFL